MSLKCLLDDPNKKKLSHVFFFYHFKCLRKTINSEVHVGELKKSSYIKKPGDWKCTSCGAENFG
jgi:hypothetical protein